MTPRPVPARIASTCIKRVGARSATGFPSLLFGARPHGQVAPAILRYVVGRRSPTPPLIARDAHGACANGLNGTMDLPEPKIRSGRILPDRSRPTHHVVLP